MQERLLQMEEEQRLPHALMLCGPMGCGKMAIAMAFAKHLLSRNGNAEAMLAKWEHRTCTSPTPLSNCLR